MGLTDMRRGLHNDDEHQQAAVDSIVVGVIDRLVAELRPSYEGQETHGAVPYPVSGNHARTRPITGRGILRGYGFRETSGAGTATVLLRAGSDASGDVVVPITLQAGESVRDWFSDEGIAILGGLFVDVTGAVDGSVYLNPES
jgi:hypothetical protein